VTHDPAENYLARSGLVLLGAIVMARAGEADPVLPMGGLAQYSLADCDSVGRLHAIACMSAFPPMDNLPRATVIRSAGAVQLMCGLDTAMCADQHHLEQQEVCCSDGQHL